ncbi:adhesive plaque matrix protein-like [Procambarus clarkii]|uniref:adhesive plaque matrix protein-like n=1 Tax=Procambarus clarkii TaxID=6728 RepID=UPI0037448D0E
MLRLVGVWMLVVLAGLAAGEPTAYGRALCYPKTHFLTSYKTQVQKVPVYSTVYKQQYIPTTLYKTVETVLHKTHYVPKVATTTHYQTQVEYVTNHQPVYHTNYLTTTAYVPKYLTETLYDTVYKTALEYRTVYKTEYQPKYTTKTQLQYDTKYETRFVPQVHTVHSYKTVCPKPAYRPY